LFIQAGFSFKPFIRPYALSNNSKTGNHATRQNLEILMYAAMDAAGHKSNERSGTITLQEK
jgi:hypothetical protein